MVFINYKKKLEYKIAEKRNKLGVHFKKLSFSIEITRPQAQSWFYAVVVPDMFVLCRVLPLSIKHAVSKM